MRTLALLIATILCAGCVCLRHAVEKPERKAVDCGRDASKPGDHLCKVRIGADDRVFVLHVPKAPSRTPQATLVLAFHGVGSNAMQMAKISKFSDLADRERFLVAYPQGLGVVPAWNTAVVGKAQRSTADEVAFVKAMLAEIESIVSVDPARVYAAGFSNGGLLSHELACRMSETFAAIGVVAAINAADTCEPVRAVPVIAFHGLRDPVVIFGGAEEIGLPSVRSSLAQWATRDGCREEPVLLDEKGEVRCEEWPGCRDGAEVVLCLVKEGHHTWPGGRNPPYMGHTTTDIDATERMWEFFLRHPMQAQSPAATPEPTPEASAR
jgi:polyhydroxybutyrate depolymerase